MKEWKDVLVELAKKLTALFAFVVLIVIVIAAMGKNIPAGFQALIYIVVIGGLLIYAVQQYLQIRARHDRGEKADKIEPPAPVVVSQPAPVETPQPAPPAIPPDVFSARECYLRAVVADCRTVRLAGIDPNASDPTRGGMSLEKLYISLDTRTPKEKPDEEQKKSGVRPAGQEPEPMSALEAWTGSPKRRMVLLGLPGTGKSTFVRYLALSMARAELSREAELPQEWKGRPLMPFILSLGRFAETIPSECRKGRAELIEDYLVQTLKNGDDTREFAPLALRALEREGGLVMFDGLDEVANLGLRPLVVQAVEDFVEKYSRNEHNYFLVTCRTYSYQHDAEWKLTDWPTHELALLTHKKIRFFIQAWYAELSQIDASRKAEYERKRDKLLETLQPGDRRQLLEIAAFPLILTIMAVVHTHYGELPDTRAQVYERCVELLLIRWQGERSVAGKIQRQNILDALDISPTVLYQALWEVAFEAHGNGDKDASGDGSAALVTEDLLDGKLKIFLQNRDKVETFLEYCQSSNGLLMLQGTLAAPGRPPRKVYA
ncbi:MAG: NACHT domain-containing protein, partial [Chloroflexota bacterium]